MNQLHQESHDDEESESLELEEHEQLEESEDDELEESEDEELEESEDEELEESEDEEELLEESWKHLQVRELELLELLSLSDSQEACSPHLCLQWTLCHPLALWSPEAPLELESDELELELSELEELESELQLQLQLEELESELLESELLEESEELDELLESQQLHCWRFSRASLARGSTTGDWISRLATQATNRARQMDKSQDDEESESLELEEHEQLLDESEEEELEESEEDEDELLEELESWKHLQVRELELLELLSLSDSQEACSPHLCLHWTLCHPLALWSPEAPLELESDELELELSELEELESELQLQLEELESELDELELEESEESLESEDQEQEHSRDRFSRIPSTREVSRLATQATNRARQMVNLNIFQSVLQTDTLGNRGHGLYTLL
ncbi:uncharacterized protein LOC132204622 [Neocloeon triangulifer]|uniref:uncharacterized protein LOC132204622 n=1 Tax=Neocloeon triangulifer TaxID=2078957 RepID=UPI00286F55E6|nr:uncharacterized protein LOC132204622 [Neocloeon triangulifer]